MASIQASPKTTADAIAKQMLDVFAHIMRAGQGPIVELAERYQLTLSQMKILFILSNRGEPMSLGELAKATTLSLPAAGRAVDAVLQSGLVTRSEDPADRRIKRIALTDIGQNAADEINETRAALVRDVVAQLTVDQRNALAAALEPLTDVLPARCAPGMEAPDTETEESR